MKIYVRMYGKGGGLLEEVAVENKSEEVALAEANAAMRNMIGDAILADGDRFTVEVVES